MNREIFPLESIHSSICLPGSKYIANRLIPMCALAQTPSRLTNVVDNHDINTAISGLKNLGYQLTRENNRLTILPRKQALSAGSMNTTRKINSGDSGTFSRFISAIAALESYAVQIDCSTKMASRPMQEIFAALAMLKVKIDSLNQCLPATIRGTMQGDYCRLDASRSSQYLSALLIVAPLLENGLQIEITGEIASPAYIDMTIELMRKLNVEVIKKQKKFCIAKQAYQGIDYQIPGDPMSASYFMAAAAIAGGEITIQNFDFDCLQGEAKFFQVLEKMGVVVSRSQNDLMVNSQGDLTAIEIDMHQMPDAVQTLAAVACFAKGVTKIYNIENLAYKESNRIKDTAREIAKTGIQVQTSKDLLIIHGGKPQAAAIDTYDDHRMAMSMALLGIKVPGITIRQAQVVNKSFPTFWDCLSSIGVKNKQTKD